MLGPGLKNDLFSPNKSFPAPGAKTICWARTNRLSAPGDRFVPGSKIEPNKSFLALAASLRFKSKCRPSQPFPRSLRGDSGKCIKPSFEIKKNQAQFLPPSSASKFCASCGVTAKTGCRNDATVGPKSLESQIFLHAFDAPKMFPSAPFRCANLLVKSAGPSASFRGLQKTFRAD